MQRAALLLLPVLAVCCAQPPAALEEPALEALGRGLPRGFLFGAASSSHQIEGGNDNDWTDWEASVDGRGRPRIRDGQRSGLATDAWNRFDEDLSALRTLGANSYRFSVEWSRLEPVEGAWNAEAMARYRAQALALRAAGIEPMVTIHHFTLPKWIAARGGFEHPATADALARFAASLAGHLGDVVDLWCPFNEMTVYAALGYLMGSWPPGVRGDVRRQVQVMRAMLVAHAGMAAALRLHDAVDADGDGKATVTTTAHHVRVFQPASVSPLDVMAAALVDDVANEAIPRAFKTGRVRLSVPGVVEIDELVPGLAGSIDALGLNYYSRDFVRADLGAATLAQASFHPRNPRSDLGWEVYPKGLHQLLVRMAAWGFPLIVTENGVADDGGSLRPRFLAAHVAALERAVAEGVDVRGYYHWSLTDNFEWAEGTSARFGLFRVDYDTFLRTPTEAVETFRAIRGNLVP